MCNKNTIYIDKQSLIDIVKQMDKEQLKNIIEFNCNMPGVDDKYVSELLEAEHIEIICIELTNNNLIFLVDNGEIFITFQYNYKLDSLKVI